ncbi:MAG TPA: hypothetical protein VKQ72_11860 [Aggregatilineales bacterium]|nr:hypothetical protein [Aggregatilineales bacterium]
MNLKHIEGPGYVVDIEWADDGQPVQYVNCHGSVTQSGQALQAVAASVKMIEESSFQHVCVVYNLLDLQHTPNLARFMVGRFPSSPKTAHIILATTNPAFQLIGSVAAVAGSRRLRTLEVCRHVEELAEAVKHWLALPDRTKGHIIENLRP